MATKSMTFKRARTPHYDDPAAVGQRVFEAREAAGLSQRELARRTGVSEQELAFGRETLEATVAERVRAAEAAESSGDAAERAAAYKALARAATKAARALDG